MNERDLRLVHTIQREIQYGSASGIYLFTTKYTNLVRVNLVVLKAELGEKHMRGVMVTVDRPHQYLSHLLQLHGIDQTDLTFVDAVSNHASDTKKGGVATEFQNGPFNIETLPDFLVGSVGAVTSFAKDFSRADFMMIDNIAAMLVFNHMENLKMFLKTYMQALATRRTKPLTTVLVMDKTQYPELYEYLTGLALKTVDLADDMTVREVRSLSPSQSDGRHDAQPSTSEVVGLDKSVLIARELM